MTKLVNAMKLIVLGCCFYCTLSYGDVELANNGTTSLTVYHNKTAAASVKNAAGELKRYLKKVSGVDIKITTQIPAGKFVSLGVNDLSREAGLSLSKIKPDGYLMAVKNGNIYIIGHDTQDGAVSTKAGFSKGTLFGTYSFIEKYLGVRWFMPGDAGEYYTKKPLIQLQDTLLVENPDFRWRRIPYLTKNRKLDGELVNQWLIRQKINLQAYRMSLIHYHVWQYVFTSEVYDKHPEYFAFLGGKRVKPVGDRYKICTSSPGAIKFHAQAAIKFFDANPQKKGYSLSPTDSAGYCQCSKCKAQDEVGQPKNGRLTRRILLFYNAVAKIVQKKYPDKYMCGYIYADYLYPPKDKSVKLAPNLFLVVASSLTYGYTFFRPEVQQEWLKIMRSWSSMTKNIAYYDLPIHSSNNNGYPLAPGVEQLRKMLPELKNFKVKALYIYGDAEWGHAVPYNYLLAKMMWNAELDVDKHLTEFYEKCYGAGGADIQKLYELIDSSMKKYYLNNSASYTLTKDIIQKVYVNNLPEIETLYFAALSKVKDPSAKLRVEMLGENLQVMYFFMKAFRVVKKDDISKFDMSKAAFEKFKEQKKNAFYLPKFAGRVNINAKHLKNVSVKQYKAGNNTEKMTNFLLRDGAEIIMQAQNDNVVKINFNRVKIRGNMLNYLILTSTGKEVASGTVAENKQISFIGSAGEVYHLFISTKSTSYNIKISDIPYAIFAGKKTKRSKGIHFLGKSTPLYFNVDGNVKEFSLTMSSGSKPGSADGGETANGELYDPMGKLVANLSTVNNPVDSKKIINPMPGCWKYKISKAEKGIFDDVYLIIAGQGMSGYISIDPENMLSISEEK